jgi:hypothetical protein
MIDYEKRYDKMTLGKDGDMVVFSIIDSDGIWEIEKNGKLVFRHYDKAVLFYHYGGLVSEYIEKGYRIVPPKNFVDVFFND